MNASLKHFAALPRSFYAQEPTAVARQLLGKVLIRHYNGLDLAGKIVETEAYLGVNDPASHSYVGKTKRNEILYGEAGHAYVHSMRQYCLLDVVTETANQPSSVLIRAVEPLEGIEAMRLHRQSDNLASLANGPGKLCKALCIDRSMNGVDMTQRGSLYIIDAGQVVDAKDIKQTARIGISKASEALLRFYLESSPRL
ncbi:MAG TPA: DNA-3-methyladenine glycosylase [Candidatus Acidoferrum sp.]|nr:DNA-3-methyladenine glycosylase [Candidatus Acidoferrum sp.]